MAQKEFGVDINLSLNELINSRAENLLAPIASNPAAVGRFMYNLTSQRLNYDTGTTIIEVANLTDVSGLLDFKGGYNATTNTPNLTSGAGILKGDYYVVTVAGTFFGTPLEVGDSLFANIDTPVTLADWTIVQGNTVPATTTVAGVIAIATQAEVDAGVIANKAVVPSTIFNSTIYPKKYTSPSTTVGSGTPVTITHNLNNAKPQVSIVRDSTGAVVTLAVDNFTANSFDVTKNGANYNVTIGVVG